MFDGIFIAHIAKLPFLFRTCLFPYHDWNPNPFLLYMLYTAYPTVGVRVNFPYKILLDNHVLAITAPHTCHIISPGHSTRPYTIVILIALSIGP
jgi:hypothetical protein